MGEIAAVVIFLVVLYAEFKFTRYLYRTIRNRFFSGRRKLSPEVLDNVTQYSRSVQSS